MSKNVSCISCEFCVVDEKKASIGQCWSKNNKNREDKNIITLINCSDWKLGAMQNIRRRKLWNPKQWKQ